MFLNILLNVMLLNTLAQVIQMLLTLKSCLQASQPPEGSTLFGILGSRERCIKLLPLKAKSNMELNCLSFLHYETLDRATEIPFEKR